RRRAWHSSRASSAAATRAIGPKPSPPLTIPRPSPAADRASRRHDDPVGRRPGERWPTSLNTNPPPCPVPPPQAPGRPAGLSVLTKVTTETAGPGVHRIGTRRAVSTRPPGAPPATAVADAAPGGYNGRSETNPGQGRRVRPLTRRRTGGGGHTVVF